MLIIFKNKIYFTVLFFVLLLIDIVVKINYETSLCRYFSKSLIVGSLIFYYFINRKEVSSKKHKLMVAALFCFLVGDVLLINYNAASSFIIGLLLFIVGKLFYAARFSNQKDFNLLRLLPFFVCCFIYMIVIMLLVIDNLNDFFIPTLVYLFACMIVFLFGILRKDAVSKNSYVLVIVGVVFSIFSDSISVLQSFYNPDFPFHKMLIMLFYGISQYFIVLGIVEEVALKTTTVVS